MYSQFYFSPTREAFRDKIRVRKFNHFFHNYMYVALFSYCQIGCGGYANRSFGHLQIDSNRGSSYVTCTFVVGRVDINQAVALVWIQDLYLSYYRY